MRTSGLILVTLACLVAAPLRADGLRGLERPPAAPVRPVTDTLWGQRVTDDYRYMEALDPQTIGWMKAQGAYTRSVLDRIAPLAALEEEVAKYSASFGLIQGYVSVGGRAFYQERAPGSDAFDLVVADAAGTRKIVDVAALRAANGGKPFAINYFLPTPDGARVAVGISEGGSEDASITVFDAASGARLAGPVDRAQFGATSWSEDSRTLYFIRYPKPLPGDPPTARYQHCTASAWDLRSEPVPILGTNAGHEPRFLPDEYPAIEVIPGAPFAAALSINGVQNEQAIWLAPAAALADPGIEWKAFVTRADGITSIDMRGAEIFLLSHQDAPTFKVLTLHAGEALAAATTLVPAAADRVVESIHAAADALYVLTRRGAYSQLLRVPAGTRAVEEVALPFAGHISEVFSDPRVPGVAITLSSWVVPAAVYAFQPASRTFADLRIGVRGDIDAARFQVTDLEAKAHDGVQVPLTLIRPRDARGAEVTIIEAYGAYGISELADFSVRRSAALRKGLSYGICHVRGGGELGEAWRLGGKDANKHNSWDDLIACGEYLIAVGTTTRERLFIIGGSAGGVTMGRALTERPELFAGVIALVPDANSLRSEFAPMGPPNIPEFGSVTTEAGFRNLLAMDSVHHVRKGVQYPAVMLQTGLNDPRVPPWEAAKFAAALQASGTAKPVLLRIDEDAGHGIGSTKSQTDLLTADWIAFVLWRAGLADWQPGN